MCAICRDSENEIQTTRQACRCTIKQPICTCCYERMYTKLNMVCPFCMERGSKPAARSGASRGSFFYSRDITQTFSHRLLSYLAKEFMDPIILPLISSNSAWGFLVYGILSIIFTLLIIIPLATSSGIELLFYNNLP